jgi:hypothetical protein
MAIYVEVGSVSVHTLTHGICHPADGENVTGTVKRQSIVNA